MGAIYYYNDFTVLGSERHIGQSVGPLPILKIYEYADREAVHDVELFKRIMLKLDVIFLRLVASERKKQEQKSKVKSKANKVK